MKPWKNRRTAGGVLGTALAGVIGLGLAARGPGTAAADDQPARVKPSAEIAKAIEESSAPAKEHEVLAALVGAFDVESRMWTDPGGNPLVSHGTGSGEWILGRRFVQVKGSLGAGAKDELKSESLTVYGFDTRKKQYTMVGFDTLGTYSVAAAGKFDAAQKILNLEGTVEEAPPGGGALRTVRFRWSVSVGDPKSVVQQVVMEIVPGTWFKVTDVAWRRR